VGKRGIGALEYEPAIETKKSESNINIADLLEVANAVYCKKEKQSLRLNDYRKSLSTLLRISSSVGGARAKALIAINSKTKEIKAGDILHKGGYKYYLIKFDGLKDGKEIEPGGYGILEYIYHKMAVDAGIEMAQCKLLKENGRAHFLTERFDRKNGKKIHTQTLCAITGIDFRIPNLIGYEDIFRVMNLLKTDYCEKKQLFRRMIFNVLAFNRDDHTKNFSFTNDDGIWKLSPAYDLIFAYDPKNFWLKNHNINDKKKNSKISKEDILSVGKQFGVKKTETIYAQVKDAVFRFNDYAVRHNLPENQRIAIWNVIKK
jgi:serine/threonine-protein kinase HipA